MSKRKETPGELAIAACNQLINAYRDGHRNGGSVEWDDVDKAARFASQATGRKLNPDED